MSISSSISVCMPYWNRADELARTLESYAQLYQHLDLEIVIADDGSPEPLRVSGGNTSVVRLPTKPRPLNPCVPINVAIAASTREIVVLTNPEVVHESPILDEMLSLHTSEHHYVQARCVDADGTVLAGPEVDYDADGRLPVPPGAHFHFCTLFSRELYYAAGGFDPDYRKVQGCDDNDWLWRLYEMGASFVTTTQHVVHHRSHTRWGLPHGRHVFESKWQCGSEQPIS